MTVKRWCRECGHYVPLTKYTRPTTKGTQQRCDDCLKAPKEESHPVGLHSPKRCLYSLYEEAEEKGGLTMIPTNKTKCCNVEMRHPTMGTVVLVRAHPRTTTICVSGGSVRSVVRG